MKSIFYVFKKNKLYFLHKIVLQRKQIKIITNLLRSLKTFIPNEAYEKFQCKRWLHP